MSQSSLAVPRKEISARMPHLSNLLGKLCQRLYVPTVEDLPGEETLGEYTPVLYEHYKCITFAHYLPVPHSVPLKPWTRKYFWNTGVSWKSLAQLHQTVQQECTSVIFWFWYLVSDDLVQNHFKVKTSFKNTYLCPPFILKCSLSQRKLNAIIVHYRSMKVIRNILCYRTFYILNRSVKLFLVALIELSYIWVLIPFCFLTKDTGLN